jgi:hypothetical protein
MARNLTRGYERTAKIVGMADAVEFIRDIDAHLSDAVAYVHKFAPSVAAECEAFIGNRAADDKAHAQQAVIFAILSPQCKFAKNVRATERMMAGLYEHYADAEAVRAVLTDDDRDNFLTAKPASRKVYEALEWLRDLDGDDMTLDALYMARKVGKVKGLGDKTIRMALALYDPTMPIYTLDVHMLRGIQNAWGGEVAREMTVNKTAYHALEAAMVAWHERNFPHLPVFVSQWALWNEWGFGEHMSHLAIFGLE